MRIIMMICIIALANFTKMTAQDNSGSELPYFQIPDYPDAYSSVAVAARVVDGLGYRYFWATENLRNEDLDYKPSDDSRTIRETMTHILGLTNALMKTVSKERVTGGPPQELSYEELRRNTLENIWTSSQKLRNSQPSEIEEFNIVFQRGETRNEFPFWNMLNGPLADAIYHTGQIVAYRRASGNPLRAGVNVFTGKTRE